MRKKLVLIIGLPLFAKRLAKELQQFDRGNSYLSLDTYYNLGDKLKFLFYIFKADVVYSINGTLNKSLALDLAFKLKKRVVMHWVGSDVSNAIEQYQKGNYLEHYLKAEHLTDASWLSEELSEIGIKAKVQYISAYAKQERVEDFSTEFAVLVYIPENRAKFYGVETILELAAKFPSVKFLLVGSNKPKSHSLENISYLGWVDNISEYIKKSVVAIRFIEHDGLSQFVLEALSKGRYVLYNYQLRGTTYTPTFDSLCEALSKLEIAFEGKKLELNFKGLIAIEKDFNQLKVIGGLSEFLTK